MTTNPYLRRYAGDYHGRDADRHRSEDEPTLHGRLEFFARHARDGDRVLDYGTGGGAILGGLAARRRIDGASLGVDISPEAIANARRRFPSLAFRPLTEPPGVDCPDGSFDLVTCSEVIEHVFETDMLFAELARVLVPGGRLLLTCPYHGLLKDAALFLSGRFDSHYHDPRSDHIRYYSRRSLARVLGDHGFRSREFAGVGRVPFLWRSMMVLATRH